LKIAPFRCDKQRLDTTETELQSALAEATQTDKKTAGVFLDTLSAIAYKDTKKNGEFVVRGNGFCGDFQSELLVTFEVKDGEDR
jgi:predicted Zn-dependent protease